MEGSRYLDALKDIRLTRDLIEAGRHMRVMVRLGLRLGVAARNGQREQILNQLMVERRLAAAVEQALAEASAMPG